MYNFKVPYVNLDFSSTKYKILAFYMFDDPNDKYYFNMAIKTEEMILLSEPIFPVNSM